MKASVLSLFLLLVTGLLLAQKEKGVSPVGSNNNLKPGFKTWAVVIGISDYQESTIPDLRFADRDAEAFAQYLRSPGGGALDNDHLQLLTNENATAGKVGGALYWLLEVCKEGDQAIIYFSGHGDVERRIIGQPGYLLCWDAPPQAYLSGGTIELGMFQSIVSTLSLEIKAKVLVVSDACHAGKLAGQNFGGAQSTTANLAKQFGNEIKILSCQPNEFSIEGEQWGGGHGVFSYHLVDGLYGLADKNTDAVVTLSELDRYLEDRVTAEAAPQSQIPMVVGNKAEHLAKVDIRVLTQLQQFKSGQLALFAPVEEKGLEDDVLASVDSSIKQIYFAFKEALKDKRYFEPVGNCAEDLYALLVKEPRLTPLHSLMKRNYAAELQDDAQQAIKRILFRPVDEMNIWFSPAEIRRVYGQYPRMLDRAAALLGPDHYMYSVLLARKAFFEGGVICLQKIYFKDLIAGAEAVKKFKESLNLEPEAPQTLLWLAWSYFFNLKQPDSAYYYINKAIDNSPTWALPVAAKSRFLLEEFKLAEAKVEIDKGRSLEPLGCNNMDQLGLWYFYQRKFQETINVIDSILVYCNDLSPVTRNKFNLEKILPLGFLGKKEEALKVFNESIKFDSLSGFPYYFLGNMYFFVREYESSAKYLAIALEKDPSMIWCYSLMGDVLIIQKHYETAEKILTEGFSRDSTYMPLVNGLGGVYQATNRLELAEAKFKKAIQLDEAFMAPYFNLATIYARFERYPEALEYLDSAIRKGLRNYDYIQNASALVALRESSEYKALMRKHFPDKVKD